MTGRVDDLVIRRTASREDAREIEGLQARSFGNPWRPESLAWELAESDVARVYSVRGPDGALVAYCTCWVVADELHINSLAVDVAWRRQGVARRLLAEVFRDALEAGARSATLEVRTSNAAARTLYERLGFAVEGVRRNYYQAPREDALVLWNRALGQG